MRLARYERAGEARLAMVAGEDILDILDALDDLSDARSRLFAIAHRKARAPWQNR